MRAYRVSERAAGTGFDWDNLAEVLEKVEEEWGEFKAALDYLKADPKNRDVGQLKDDVQLEFGDLIFTLVNVARFAGFHPETAVAGGTRKFEQRFRWMEKRAAARSRSLENSDRVELEQSSRRGRGAPTATQPFLTKAEGLGSKGPKVQGFK